MDFVSAEPIAEALHRRIDHAVFGYHRPPQILARLLQDRLRRLYRWDIREQDIIFLPGIVAGLNVAFQAFSEAAEEILVQPPVYFHFLRDPVLHGRALLDPPLVRKGSTYEIDFGQFEKAITKKTRIFVLCNPHNPVGRVFTKIELEKIAEICLRHRLLICSDEIHCELVFPPHYHIPIATISPEVEAVTITLMAPSKTYNVAGLECGYAFIRSPKLRRAWKDFTYGLIPGANIMGYTAAAAALKDGQEWLDQVLVYLQANRDYVSEFINRRIPSIQMCNVEATYLAWLDCSGTGIGEKPAEFFLKNARVALSDGLEFGKGGANFVRLNFACPRRTLTEALERMAAAVASEQSAVGSGQ
jgi:cystathionine beta-lyase